MKDARSTWLQNWLDAWFPDGIELKPVSGDASFRRYFRAFTRSGQTYIVMDAPPQKEPLHAFLDINERLRAAGVHAPVIHAHDTEQGFVLLEDLGSTSYLDSLKACALSVHFATSPDIDGTSGFRCQDTLYAEAFAALIRIQKADTRGLLAYDASLLGKEIDLFDEWFLGRHLNLRLGSMHAGLLATTRENLIASALEQPCVFVHRDYHSRNLMWLPTNSPGVLDHQDAVCGPFTYDLVSLLRDAYVAWPSEKIRRWALQYHALAITSEVIEPIDEDTFLRWFDLMGLQRHLKILGIFARLHHRDRKSGYLADMPRVLTYVADIAPLYPQSQPLAELLSALPMDALLKSKAATCAP